MIFALNKLIEYCEQNDGWDNELQEINKLIEKIRLEVQREDAKLKEEAPANRFWTAFREWMYNRTSCCRFAVRPIYRVRQLEWRYILLKS